jgi:hypothetical protein
MYFSDTGANPSTIPSETGTQSVVSLKAHADGSVSPQATSGYYVTAENTGASPLIANRTPIGTWEEFDLITDWLRHAADKECSRRHPPEALRRRKPRGRCA